MGKARGCSARDDDERQKEGGVPAASFVLCGRVLANSLPLVLTIHAVKDSFSVTRSVGCAGSGTSTCGHGLMGLGSDVQKAVLRTYLLRTQTRYATGPQ